MSAQRSVIDKHVSVENETVNVAAESNYSYSQKGKVARTYIDDLMNNVHQHQQNNETDYSKDQYTNEQFENSLLHESQKIG